MEGTSLGALPSVHYRGVGDSVRADLGLGNLAVRPSYGSKDQSPEICVKIKTAMAEDEELRLASRVLCPGHSRMFANVVLGGLSAMPHGRLLVAASR